MTRQFYSASHNKHEYMNKQVGWLRESISGNNTQSCKRKNKTMNVTIETNFNWRKIVSRINVQIGFDYNNFWLYNNVSRTVLNISLATLIAVSIIRNTKCLLFKFNPLQKLTTSTLLSTDKTPFHCANASSVCCN